MGTAVQRGRGAFGRREWSAAYADLRAADERRPLEADDLEQLAVAAYLIGRDECATAWSRAFARYAEGGEFCRAARSAFWLGWALFYKGQLAQSSGWFARAQRTLDEHGTDCSVTGLLMIPAALQHLGAGDGTAAYEGFLAAGEIGAAYADRDLVVLSRLGVGQALIRLGRVAEGVTLLDEAMACVTAGEVGPIAAGTVYCAVLLECQALGDLRRAVEWTDALSAWCGSDPRMVPFRGQCLVHRAEVMHSRGEWARALAEAQRACEVLSRPPPQPAVGMAHYQLAELRRVRGEFTAAEHAYREASRCGLDPEPGLALLRLAEGRPDAAEAAIRGALGNTDDARTRARLLAAVVEVALARDDTPVARHAADELATLAEQLGVELLAASASAATGAVLLAEGDPAAARDRLRHARHLWQRLEVPYEVARTRALIGRACRELGDDQTAQLELEAAQWTFQWLGAAPDLARLIEPQAKPRPERTTDGKLTGREREVLALIASGKTNHEIAQALVLSDHTVRRHVQNIFAKVGVSTRAAATAYALQHGLV